MAQAPNSPLENLTFQAGSAGSETIPCPLCGKLEFRTIVVEQSIPIVRCKNCSLTFANPRPTREGLQRFYDNYFPPESAPLWQKQMADIFLKEGLFKIDDFVRSGQVRLSNPPSLLDVGCGMGFFLDLMRKHSWEVKGIEPAPEAARHAKEQLELDVTEGTIEQVKLVKQYDVITLWYVLEHVPNPHEILDHVKNLLHPGGLVIIRVPNQNAVFDRILNWLRLGRFFLINPPRHLFDYSPHTISKFLIQRGFKILSIRNGIPRGTGTFLELFRRHAWFGFFETLYHLTGGKLIRGSSMTVYAVKI